MLVKKNHIQPEVLSATMQKKAIRDGFGEGLELLGEENKNVVALCADLLESTRVENFAKRFPTRYFEAGVAEQNMAGIAAGLGVSGKIPYIASFATFSPGRNWEQIRTAVAYNDSNVKMIGHHAGLATGEDGATHQALEDIAIMRALPNMKVIVPCDAEEAKKATLAVAHIWGPVYIRISRQASPVITTANTPFVPGKGLEVWRSKKPSVTIIACGYMVWNALKAAQELEKQKIGSVVVNMHTIKPLDEKLVADLAKTTGAIVTVEDHQTTGGLGGAVAEAVAAKFPVPIQFVGVRNQFGQSGTPAELLKLYRMDVVDIVEAAKKAIRQK